jgi:hypothetical protein
MNDVVACPSCRMDPEGESTTRVGMILGIVAAGLMVVMLLFGRGVSGAALPG